MAPISAFIEPETVLRRALLILVWSCLLLPAAQAAPTFLFDATKAETAGNADWVVDEDNHVAARYPTPPASGITASTPETYWTGALSSWDVALVQMGYNVEQLPVGGRLTYGDSTNAQDLSHYQVYVVCEPNILFTAAEKLAMIKFVQAGGSLFVISDHAGSDRNNDGNDSVQIWNDFFTNNGLQANPFGVAINSTDISLVSTYYDTAKDDPLTNGPLGPATALQFSDGATITLGAASNASVRAAFWSSAAHTNSNVMAAWGTFGAGRFVVETDSSPPDDGIGSSGHTLYAGWTEQSGNHSRFFLNASVWLAAAANRVPANDNFADAAVLTGASASATVANTNATKETGEPNHGNNPGGHSVWWAWTAPANGSLTVSTVGSNFDTTLGVYTGTAVNTLTTLAEDDNSGGDLTSLVTLGTVTAGTTYFFAVDGYNGKTGTVTFNLGFTGTPPANDNFANAAVLSGLSTSATADNTYATLEANESAYGHTVWWQWTAPDDLVVTLRAVSNSGSYSPLSDVYTGSSLGALSVVTDSFYGLVTFQARRGVTYSFQVGSGGSGRTGLVTLALTSQPLPTVTKTVSTPDAFERGQVPGVVTFTFDKPVPVPVDLSLYLVGSATFGADYSTLPTLFYGDSGTLTMPAHQRSISLTVVPVDDNDPTEGDETVQVYAYSDVHYLLADSVDPATVTIHDDTPYTAAWYGAYVSAGFSGAAAAPGADPDHDGIPNLLEFAFNLNPLAADGPAALPVLGTGLFADPTDPADSTGTLRRFPTLTFTRRTDAPNLTYAVETTTDLAANNWDATTPVFVSSTTANMPANTEQAVYRAPLPQDGPDAAPRQFLRVRVTALPAPTTTNSAVGVRQKTSTPLRRQP